MRRPLLFGAAGLLLALLVLAVVWLLRSGSEGGGYRISHAQTASNPALDVRFTYDGAALTLADFDPAAEFALRLDGADWSFYGKRIQGLGAMLGKDPAPMLYDFVGSQHNDVFESWYGLKPVGEPLYEDVKLGGKLGLHTRHAYALASGSRGWPEYFPASVTGKSGGKTAQQASVEGWALFTAEDLFFFYAVAPQPLTERQLELCEAIIRSMQFGAVLGAGSSDAPTVPEEQLPEVPVTPEGL
jgi:hypothetical protein